VIKIRYSDLPGGLHLSAEVRGNHTFLFLLPGLTAAQRKAAIRRARSAARVGHGPQLPALGLARAIAADRVATTVRNGFAAIRMHPAILIPPMIVVLAATIAYFLLASVSFPFIPSRAAEPGLGRGAGGGGAVHRFALADLGNRPASGATPGSPGRRLAAVSLQGAPGPPSAGSWAWPAPGPSARRPPGWPSASAARALSRSPSAPGPAGGGVCVKVSLLGVCAGV